MNFLLLQIPKINDSLIKDTTQISKNAIDEANEKTLSIIELITSGGIGGNLVMGALGIL